MIWARTVSFPTLVAFKLKRAEGVDRGAGHRVANLLLHRQAFPGEHRFIDGRVALNNPPVDRDLLPRPDDNDLANLYFGNRDVHLLPVPDDPGCLCLQPQELLNRRRGSPFGHRFQVSSQGGSG